MVVLSAMPAGAVLSVADQDDAQHDEGDPDEHGDQDDLTGQAHAT